MAAATSQALRDFYTWGFSNSPVQVHLYLEVVSKIRKQIQDSEKDPGEFSAYGLLTGDTPQPGITRILDSKSLQTLDAVSVVAASASTFGAVVGFYRTTPIGSISMLDEDKALAARLFRYPSSVFLLIETGPSGIGDARFCFWGEHELFDWPLMLFPLDAEELAVEERRRRSNMVREPSQSSHSGLAQVPSPADERVGGASEVGPGRAPAQAATHPVAIAAKPGTKRRQGTVLRRLALALTTVVAAALLAGAFLYFRRGINRPVAPQAAPPAEAPRAEVKAPLGLTVERRGSSLLVSWDGNADVISKANFGMLLIRGSKVSRDVPLTAEELRAGKVVYAAPEDLVRFQLNVVAGEQVTRESLTFVLPGIAASRPSLTSSPGGNSNAGERPPSQALGEPAPRTELREFKQVANRGAATATPPRIDEPPAVTGATPVQSGTLSVLNQPPVAWPAAVSIPANRSPQAEPPLPESAAHPPVASHQVLPGVPPLLRGKLWTPTAVEVTVSVDASGNVVKAEAVAKRGLHPLLRDAAVQAAQRWKFQPAQFGGHAVPANIVLQFNFAASR